MRGLGIVLLLAMAGCSTNQPLRPHMEQNLAQLLTQQGFDIEVQVTDEQLIQGDMVLDARKMLDAGNASASSIHATAQGASMGGPGASAAGVMLGSVLVNQLNRSRSQSEAEKQADARIAPLREAMANQALDLWFRQALTDELTRSALARPSNRASGPYKLRFAPRSELGQALDSTRLITEISLWFGREVLYQGRIEVISEAAWEPGSTGHAGLEPWLLDDAQAYREALHANLRETLRVLVLDLETQHFAALTSPETTLRYAIGSGRIVERGRLIADDGTRALYMDLRGWLKSVPLQ